MRVLTRVQPAAYARVLVVCEVRVLSGWGRVSLRTPEGEEDRVSGLQKRLLQARYVLIFVVIGVNNSQEI